MSTNTTGFGGLAVDDAAIVDVLDYYVSTLTNALMAEIVISDGNLTARDYVDVNDLIVVTE